MNHLRWYSKSSPQICSGASFEFEASESYKFIRCFVKVTFREVYTKILHLLFNSSKTDLLIEINFLQVTPCGYFTINLSLGFDFTPLNQSSSTPRLIWVFIFLWGMRAFMARLRIYNIKKMAVLATQLMSSHWD